MKLVFFVLNRPEKLDDLLTAFAQSGINGATVIESKGMIKILNNNHDEDEIPFLGSVRAFLSADNGRMKNNVIMIGIEDEKLETLVEVIESVVGNLNKKGTGVLFSVPMDYTKGMYKDGK